MILEDLLKPNLDVVFCGTAVSNLSAERKSYYAGPGNKFYPILFKTELTQRLLNPTDYRELLNFDIGLTDLVKYKSGNDNVLNNDDFDRQSLIDRIERFEPRVLCFNGKAAASVLLFNRSNKTRDIKYGFIRERIGKTKLFVAPSTSGSANGYWDESYWFLLKNEIDKLKAE